MRSPEISVIICTYNRKNMLELALAAYQHQTFRNIEVIVTSDGSSDGTDEMIEAFRKEAGFLFHYVRQEDKGFRKSLAVNKAVRIARGKILVFADDDMIPPPEYLESYYRTFCAAADINSLLVYSKYIPVDTGDKLFTMENIRNGSYMKRFSLSDRFHLLYWKWKYQLYIRKNHPKRPKLNGNNFAVSAAAVRAVNGLDGDFTGWGYEDDDLRRRLLAIGTQQAEAVCTAWNFNLGYSKANKTTAQRPDLLARVEYNKALAYDNSRPARCVNGMAEAEAGEIVF